jgi:hypothetical protein
MVDRNCFAWWFMMGAGITLALVLLHHGLAEAVQRALRLWPFPDLAALLLALGGGLLAGCLALVADRLSGGSGRLLASHGH